MWWDWVVQGCKLHVGVVQSLNWTQNHALSRLKISYLVTLQVHNYVRAHTQSRTHSHAHTTKQCRIQKKNSTACKVYIPDIRLLWEKRQEQGWTWLFPQLRLVHDPPIKSTESKEEQRRKKRCTFGREGGRSRRRRRRERERNVSKNSWIFLYFWSPALSTLAS